jgi:hypothetical protein
MTLSEARLVIMTESVWYVDIEYMHALPPLVNSTVSLSVCFL